MVYKALKDLIANFSIEYMLHSLIVNAYESQLKPSNSTLISFYSLHMLELSMWHNRVHFKFL